MRTNTLVAIVVVVLTLAGAPVTAQPTSELLEKGIYTEETVGDIDRAIELYRKIVDDDVANRPHIAEALFRLGMCHLKNDEPVAATEAFERVITEFSDQERFVARARTNMPDDPEALELLPAPWNDGEVQRMTLKLTSGTTIGTVLLTADSIDEDGEEFWRLRIRRRVFSDANNQAISQVVARRDSMAPVTSSLKHTVVGHFEAVYGDGTVNVTTVGPDTTREEEISVPVFDNEEGFHLFRRLPLDVGYKAKVNILAPWAGGVIPIELEIPEKEMISVPAGDFECYRMEFNRPQTFWFSTDSSHTLVKLEASGIIGELEEVVTRDPQQRPVYDDDELGYAVSAPSDWLFHELKEGNITTLLLLDPMADSQARLEVRRASDGHLNCTAQSASWHKLEQAREVLRNYTLRDGSWTEREISGRQSLSFIGDYVENDVERVHYWTFIRAGDLCTEFTLKTEAELFEDLRSEFDTIVESFDGPRSPVEPPTALSPSEEAVQAVITDFHLAATLADGERYFGQVAPDLVFLGSDPTERIDVEQLRSLAEPYFSQGKGWVAVPREQHVVVAEDSGMAWFDERLDSRNLGEMRASGVLRRDEGRWRIVQYHVAFPVPNALSREVIEKINELDSEPPSVDPAPTSGNDAANAVRSVLGELHQAKAEADGARYFGQLSPESVFLGTDRSERFDLEQYRAVAGPYFERGIKRISVPLEQNVYLSPDEKVAWFDERFDREGFGKLRGTGVLRKVHGSWKVVHYNLVIPVPNELSEGLVEQIRTFYAP